MKHCVIWLFGRGVSMACNLKWNVPKEWRSRPREEQIRLIRDALSKEMERPEIDTTVYQKLLCLLATKTSPAWAHMFVTTNWDYLLEREIEKQSWSRVPPWLPNTHVYHLNGTIEPCQFDSIRSPFLLETDPPEQRESRVEANVAFSNMSSQQMFVVAGMSFECHTDRFLLLEFSRIEDDRPIGESRFIIVNRNRQAVDDVFNNIQEALPQASIQKVCLPFQDWIANGMPELRAEGVLIEEESL